MGLDGYLDHLKSPYHRFLYFTFFSEMASLLDLFHPFPSLPPSLSHTLTPYTLSLSLSPLAITLFSSYNQYSINDILKIALRETQARELEVIQSLSNFIKVHYRYYYFTPAPASNTFKQTKTLVSVCVLNEILSSRLTYYNLDPTKKGKRGKKRLIKC